MHHSHRDRPSALLLALFAAAVSVGCKGAGAKSAQDLGGAGTAPANATCAAIGGHVSRFGEVLDDVGESGKPRRASYAGVLETLLTFERAAGERVVIRSGFGPAKGGCEGSAGVSDGERSPR